jgi:GTP-binding protein
VLLHLVDSTTEHAGKAYKIIRTELAAYDDDLAAKPEIVALSKTDSLSPELLKEQVSRLKRAAKKTPIVLSSIAGDGVQEALRQLFDVIGAARAAEAIIEKPVLEKNNRWQP